MTEQSSLTAYDDTERNNEGKTSNDESSNLNKSMKSVSSDVIETFDSLQSWKDRIQVNNSKWLYVGGKISSGKMGSAVDTYRLYHMPENDENGIAGYVRYNPGHLDDTEKILVSWTSEGDAEFSEDNAIDVDVIESESHSRCKELDNVLPLIRSQVMESDWLRFGFETESGELPDEKLMHENIFSTPIDKNEWVAVDPDPGFSDWGTSCVPLSRFYANEYNDDVNITVALKEGIINSIQVQHAIGRYPMNARKMLCNIESKFAEGGFNPEAFRTLLLDFAMKWTYIESTPIEINHTMKFTKYKQNG